MQRHKQTVFTWCLLGFTLIHSIDVSSHMVGFELLCSYLIQNLVDEIQKLLGSIGERSDDEKGREKYRLNFFDIIAITCFFLISCQEK